MPIAMVSENEEVEESTLTFLQTFGTEMVDLYIGPEKQHFRVHKELLCRKVSYFDKMFNGGFEEASTSICKFPDDTPEAIDVLLGWVYNGTIRQLRDIKQPMDGKKQSMAWDFIEFYRLAQKLYLSELQDMALDHYIKWCNEGDSAPKFDYIGEMYTDTPTGSSIRKFAVRILRYLIASQDKDADEFWPVAEVHGLLVNNPELAVDYLKSIRSSPNGSEQDPFYPSCDYHTHGAGQLCYLNKQPIVHISKKRKRALAASSGSS